ncbi:MAG: hypothetical protein E6G44_10430, partial [Actinobacteria bacterium]
MECRPELIDLRPELIDLPGDTFPLGLVRLDRAAGAVDGPLGPRSLLAAGLHRPAGLLERLRGPIERAGSPSLRGLLQGQPADRAGIACLAAGGDGRDQVRMASGLQGALGLLPYGLQSGQGIGPLRQRRFRCRQALLEDTGFLGHRRELGFLGTPGRHGLHQGVGAQP